ncbi:MAG: hypothetical protein QNK66_09920 [Porticoccaceae bacterium]
MINQLVIIDSYVSKEEGLLASIARWYGRQVRQVIPVLLEIKGLALVARVAGKKRVANRRFMTKMR